MAEEKSETVQAAMSLTGHISKLPSGQRADLRSDSDNATYWRVLYASGLSDVPVRDEAKRDFARIVAILVGTTQEPNLHKSETGLGWAMFKAGINSAAIERLLSADAPTRREMMARHARRMTRSGTSFNVAHLAKFVLHEEPVVTIRTIAKDYYAAENQESRKEKVTN